MVRVQHGAIAHWQLIALGWSADAIARATGSLLHRVHRGVYAVGRPTLPDEGRWMAAVLACGHGAALSHESAAVLFRILDEDKGGPHVSVPADRHPQHPAITVHRRTHMPDVGTCAGIPVVDPLYTLTDLSASRLPGEVEALVNTADKLGLVRWDEALTKAAHLGRRPGAAKLRRVLTSHQATDSGLERRFLKLSAAAGLPRPLTQAVLHGYRVDFYWPELGLVVETDGLTYHRTPAQQAKDRVRDQALTAAGLTCLRFTNAQVRRQAAAVVRTLTAVARRLSA